MSPFLDAWAGRVLALCVPALAAAGGTALAAAVLAALARRLGWIDRAGPGERARKPRRTPVPLVGGAAILCGLAAFAACRSALGAPLGLPWLALLAAAALGALDDLRGRGLGAGTKLLGQALVGLVLALELSAGPGAALLYVLAAVVAQNAINTFDNSDGAATLAGGLAASAQPGVAAALLAFLPFNLLARGAGGDERAPRAYLGDCGSHLIGVLCIALPYGWLGLLLPLLDLARVALVRLRRGRAPWAGDRRHLAHRLALAGLAPAPTALLLAAIAAPPFVARVLAAGTPGEPAALSAGVALTLLGFVAAVLATPDPDAPAGADTTRLSGRAA